VYIKLILVAPTTTQIDVGCPPLPVTRAKSIGAWEDEDALSSTIINDCLENNMMKPYSP
jgi:hypothetical protein